MGKSLAEALENLQTKAGSISGVKEAPVLPPENASAFPFAVSYARSGTVEVPSDGWTKGLHTVFTEFHVSRVLLTSAISQVLSLMDSFFTLIKADPILGNTVDTVVFPMRYTFGELSWGGVPTIGVRIETTVKIQG